MKTIPVIIGPTAIGKSSLALVLARNIGGEIVSCDSRQIYCAMDIGTAKPDRKIQEEIPHHLIDIVDPDEEYSAGRWASDAEKCIADILQRGKVPIICGGTFFYFRTLRDGLSFSAPQDIEFRNECLNREEKNGKGTLYKELLAVDEKRAGEIHSHDIYRIIRALQIANNGGQPCISDNRSAYRFETYSLFSSRDLLYQRINRRVERMMERGLLEEFLALRAKGYTEDSPGLCSVGYRELFNYIHSLETKERCVERIQQNTRRYAKRQMTWLRNQESESVAASFDTECCSEQHIATIIAEKLGCV